MMTFHREVPLSFSLSIEKIIVIAVSHFFRRDTQERIGEWIRKR